MAALKLHSVGTGEPLLLLHGTGTSHRTWRPLLERLAERRRILLVDLPGHGDSPSVPDGTPPTPRGYAAVLVEALRREGIERPAVAGFSVGGWTALELARIGRASSVVALAPAGLWSRNPRSSVVSLWAARRMSRAFRPIVPLALASPAGRTLFLAQNFGKPWKVPADAAIAIAEDMAATRDFDEHLRQTSADRFADGTEIDVPVTVAFGSREALIPRRARLRGELPADTRWIVLPGCGHIPFWDDPDLVTQVILEGTQTLDEPELNGADGAFVHSRATGERFRPLAVPRHLRRAVTRLDWYLEPGRTSPAHVHPHQEERVIGVSGELTLQVAGETRVCGPGDVVPIPAGESHTFANHSHVDAHMLVEFRPALNTTEFFTAIAGLTGDSDGGGGKRPNPLRAAVALRHYRGEFRLGQPPAPIQTPLLMALAAAGRLVGYRLPPTPTASRPDEIPRT